LECFLVALLLFLLALVVGCIEKQEVMLKQNCLYWIKATMETFRFAPGVPKPETKQQKKERIRKEKIRKFKENLRAKRRLAVPHRFPSFLNEPRWRILPESECDKLATWIDTLPSKTYFGKILDVQKSIDKVKTPLQSPFVFPKSSFDFKEDYLHKAAKVLGLLQRNQDMRWCFKKLLLRMRICSMKKANESDPFTLDAIKQPIFMYSFSQRTIYTFEAESFAKHFHKNLMTNDGQIPLPQFPKNPLTNEVISLPQLLGLYHQCKAYGYSFWSMEALKDCSFSLPSFVSLHTKPLRFHALQTTLAKKTDWDAIDMVYDFIKTQYRTHNVHFPTNIYKWAVNHATLHDHIEAWRKLCKQWYETDILIEDDDTKDRMFGKVETLSKNLCEVPDDLITSHVSFLKTQRRTDGSRGT
jgi:hypothetical protein